MQTTIPWRKILTAILFAVILGLCFFIILYCNNKKKDNQKKLHKLNHKEKKKAKKGKLTDDLKDEIEWAKMIINVWLWCIPLII